MVACATLALFVRPPYPGNLAGREGYLLNIYTRPAWRRRGMANALLVAMVAYAREQQLGKLWLHASSDGRYLRTVRLLPAIPPASSAFLPVSLLFLRRADPLSPGCVLGALGGIAAFLYTARPIRFQSSDHLCRRWRCRYPLW